jgi:hypothetical protein
MAEARKALNGKQPDRSATCASEHSAALPSGHVAAVLPSRRGQRTSDATLQSSKPQSLAHGLNDSPGGLAAWFVEKFRAWSDCNGEVESRFTKDELLTQVMIYWVTESIGSSFLPHYDYANAGALTWIQEGVKNWIGSSKVPAAFALFPKDISHPPREWAERFFAVQRWTEMPRGVTSQPSKSLRCSPKIFANGSDRFAMRTAIETEGQSRLAVQAACW